MKLFATEANAQEVTRRLRRLRGIPLAATGIEPDRRLAAFHEAEVWEEAAFLNQSLSQLACGDVFSTPGRQATWFVLLAAPCDIMLRNDGSRGLKTATFIPMRELTDTTEAAESHFKLPFILKGKQWYCDLRETAPVKLATLDLATLRLDGQVRVDKDQTKPDGLMDGQEAIYEERTHYWLELLNMGEKARRKMDGQNEEELQLTFAGPEGFNPIQHGEHKHNKNDKAIVWGLKREGRIRMPYISALHHTYLARMSRHAFDVNYIEKTSSQLGTTSEARRQRGSKEVAQPA